MPSEEKIDPRTFGSELQSALSKLRKSKVLDTRLFPKDTKELGELPSTVEVLLANLRRRHETPGLFLAVAQAVKGKKGNVVIRGNHVVKPGKVLFVTGDLEIRGHLDVVGTLVVSGSLSVDGVLGDCGPDSLIAIGRNVSVGHLNTDGEMVVGGDLRADGAVYGYYNDNSLLVAGAIEARLLIEDEHDVRCGKGVRAKHHFDIDRFQQGHGPGVQEALRKLLVPEVFKGERSFTFTLLSAGPKKEALFKTLVRKYGYPPPYFKESPLPIDLMQYGNVTKETVDSVRRTIDRAGGRCSMGTEKSVMLERDRLFKRARQGLPVFLS